MFDTRRFLEDMFKTPSGLKAFLMAYGVEPPKEDTIYKWFSREAVPSNWFARLLCYLEIDRGQPVSLTKYI